MNLDRAKLYEFLAENGFIIIFIIWCVFLSIATPNFLTVSNLMTVLRQASIIGIVAHRRDPGGTPGRGHGHLGSQRVNGRPELGYQ
jgi:hypothetical protein